MAGCPRSTRPPCKTARLITTKMASIGNATTLTGTSVLIDCVSLVHTLSWPVSNIFNKMRIARLRTSFLIGMPLHLCSRRKPADVNHLPHLHFTAPTFGVVPPSSASSSASSSSSELLASAAAANAFFLVFRHLTCARVMRASSKMAVPVNGSTINGCFAAAAIRRAESLASRSFSIRARSASRALSDSGGSADSAAPSDSTAASAAAGRRRLRSLSASSAAAAGRRRSPLA